MKKRHNSVKVVLVTLVVLILLTWILPAAYFQNSYVEQGRIQMGLFDLFNYPMTALSYFGYISIFVLAVGGFYGILNKIGAYRKLLDNISTFLKKRGKLSISLIIILLAVITSICGLQLGLMIFFPFLISIILLMGYDKIVAALTIVGSTMIGVAGTTFASSNVSVLVTALGVKLTTNILVKIIILVLGLALLIFNTVKYIAKLEKTNTKTKKTSTKKTDSKKAATKKDSVKTVVVADIEGYVPSETKSKAKVWPLITLISIMFVIMILSFIPWSTAFNITAFETVTANATKVEVIGKLLGSVNPFGSWTLTDLTGVILMISALLVFIYRIKFNEALQAFITGAKRALEPAALIILIYTCLVVVTYHPFQLVIYKAIFGLTKGFNVFTSFIAAILASVFNADPLYTFQSVVPYLASIVSDKNAYSIISVVYQSVYGVVMLIAPTSIVLMSILSYLGISYKEWLKNIWKLLLELFVLLIVIFTILVLI